MTINLIAQAAEMRAKFVFRKVWDTTIPINRYQIIYDVLADTSGGSPVGLFIKAVDMSFGAAHFDNAVWNYTYDQMLDVFDMAMRLAKLEPFT